MAEISRARYAALYGPTAGDRVRLADTDLLIEVTEDRCGGPGPLAGDEAIFGGGKVIRESMGQSVATRAEGTPDLVITGAVVLDYWGVIKADVGVRDGRIVALGKAGNPDTMDGVTPGLVIGPSTEILAGNGMILTAGGIDSHVHLIAPQQIPVALAAGMTTLIGGGTGPAEGTKATTVTPGRVLAGDDAGRHDALAGQHRPARQGQHGQRRRPLGAAAGGRVRVQAARGLGLDPGGDRRLPDRGPGGRRPGGDPHRHPQRSRLPGVDPGGHRRPADPHLPHRRRRRRPRAGHHQGRLAAERAAVLDQPDPALHPQHLGRASRHAHGLPPPELLDPRGPGLRRVADPAFHHGRRGRPARPGRDLDDRLGLPGHGPDRRDDHQDLADGPRHEAAPRPAARRRRRRQHARPPVRGQVHHRPGGDPRARRADRLGASRASWPTWCCGSRPSSPSGRTWCSRPA